MKKKEEGTALILVLLVVAIITVIGVTSVDRIQFGMKESSSISLKQQSFWYALGLESKASNFLEERNNARNLSNIMMFDEDLPKIKVEIKGGYVEGSLEDLTTCFNLNGLVRLSEENKLQLNQSGVDQFKNLLSALRVDDFDQEKLIFSLVDWIDSNNFTEDATGAEDDFYTRLESPYQTANQAIFNINELMNIKNFEKDFLNLLLPFVCATPKIGSSFVNVNAIKKNQPEILVMLFGEKLSLASASNILADRPLAGFVDREELLSHPELSDLNFSNSSINNIKLSSDFYKLTTKVKNFDYPYILSSYLEILESGKVRVIQRTQGVF
mgnify:FL=1|tara:strand:- start:2755 stop:3735 length:981 start_codon:yes stop_codon:yes gene_type:complete